MKWILVPALLVGMTGCKVDPALQAEIAKLTENVKVTANRIIDAEGRIAVIYADFKAGKLTKEQVDVEFAKTKMDLEVFRTQLADGKTALAAAEARAKEQGMGAGDILLNTLIAVGSVILGRRLGVPGLASKVQPAA